MLSVLTFALLAFAIVLGVVLSSDNLLGVFSAEIGVIILFPLAVISALLSVGLSALGGVLPVAGKYGVILGTYVDGGYGFPGLYYLIGSTILWFITVLQYADEEADEDAETDETSAKADDMTDTDGADSDDREVRELTDLSGVSHKKHAALVRAGYSTPDDVAMASQTELADVVGNDLAARIKGDVDDTTDTNGTDSADSEIRELTDLNGVDEATAEKLSGAGFETVEHISAADQDQLQSVEGVSTALAARIKAETDDIEVSDEVDADVEEKRKKTQQQIRQNEYQEKLDSARSTLIDVDTLVSDTELQDGLNKLDNIESRIDSLAQEYSDRHQTDEIDKLRESINKKRKEIEQGRKIQEKIQSIRSDLDDIEHLATYEKFEKAHQRLEQLGSEIESAKETASKYEFDDLQDELAKLNHQRQEQLEEVKKSHREQQEYQQLVQEVNNISNDLQKIETLIKNKEVEQARQNLEQLGSDIESAKDTASNYEFDELQDELAKLNQQRQEQLEEIKKRRQLRQEAENTSDELESDDQEKSESGSHAGEDTSKTTGTEEVDKQLEAEKEAVGSHIEDALSAPFRDPESTRKQLIQGHKMMAELAESAAESEREDILESAERSLGEIENQLEALSEATDSLTSARSRVPPDKEPSDSMSISKLEAARVSYTSAIDIADEAGFDTEGLENERADISSTLERIEEQATREELLEILQSLHSRLGRAPKATELPEDCKYSQYDYRTAFGSWDEALEAAGIDREKSMLEELERVAEKLGRVPNYADMDEHGSYSGPNYMSYFGSWSEALERADVEQNVDSGSGSDDREAMLEVVRELNNQLGRAPKTTELPEECDYSPNDFYNEFGSWDETLEAAGMDKEQDMLDEIERVAEKLGRAPKSTDMDEHGTYLGLRYSQHFGSWGTALDRYGEEDNRRERLLKTLRSLDDRLNHYPKATDFPEECEYSRADFYIEFGSWEEALEAAGIDGKEALSDDIERVAEKVGRVPTSSDMDEHGAYSISSYWSYFDSWSAPLGRFGVEDYREEKMTETLQFLDDRLDQFPKATDLPEECEYSRTDFINEFGSWEEALEAAGIDKKESLIDDLKKVAAEVGGRPDTTTHNRFGEYSPSMHKEYFGSWNAALEAADVLSMDTAIGQRQETEEQYSGPATLDPATSIDDIEDKIDGVGRGSIRAVKKAEYNTLGELQDAKPDEITKYKGVGRTKALKLIRFANENVSGNSASSGQSSGHQQSVGQSSSSTPGTNSNQIEPSALNTSWETIPANERIDEQFLIRVTDVDQQVGNRKTAQLDVQDQNGRKFGMNIWSKHDVYQEWSEGEWYALENARGKVWESNDGTTRKQFSSTKGLKVVELGPDFDPNTASVGDSSETASEPEESGATTDEDTSMSSAGRPTSNGNNGDSDSGGILGEITDEFEEL